MDSEVRNSAYLGSSACEEAKRKSNYLIKSLHNETVRSMPLHLHLDHVLIAFSLSSKPCRMLKDALESQGSLLCTFLRAF